MQNTFNIPVNKIREVEKFLQKLQRRARRAGVEDIFTFSFAEETKVQKFETVIKIDGDREEEVRGQYHYRVLTINQDITVHEGWVPIAKLDVATQQMKVYQNYDKNIEGLGEKLWTKKCDHCGHSKIVHTAYVMQNGAEYMKVGKGCMKELAPATATRIGLEFDIYAMWYKHLKDIASVEGGGGGGGNYGGYSSADYVYDKSTIILALRASLEKDGGEWVTSRYELIDDYRGTRNGMLLNQGHRTFDHMFAFVDKKYVSMIPDQAYVDSVINDVKTVIEKFPAQVGEKIEEFKNFVENEKLKIGDIFVIKRAQAIIKKQAEIEAMKVSNFQGEVGTKVPFELEVVSEKHGQGTYGPWTLYIMKDAVGNMFKKFGVLNDKFKGSDGKYRFIAPIKNFETYQDVKYTVLGGPLSKFQTKK